MASKEDIKMEVFKKEPKEEEEADLNVFTEAEIMNICKIEPKEEIFLTEQNVSLSYEGGSEKVEEDTTNQDQVDDEEELLYVPEDALEEASAARYQMLPEKSKFRYHKELEKFKQWQAEKMIKGIDENVMIAYFKNIGAASAWSRYSMLKSTLFVFHNVDISRFCGLTSSLKTKCKNYRPRKAGTFSRKDICKFLLEAPDQHWILQKVVLMMGIFGGCRCDELCRITVNDIVENFEGVNPTLTVKIPISNTGEYRSFTVVENGMGVNFLDIYKKYKERRPIPNGRLFLQCRKGIFITQVLGVNSIAKIPLQIAEYLKLPEKEGFTGHSFRRTSVTLLADSGGDILPLKRHGSWNSNNVAESYVSVSTTSKIQIGEKISENGQDYSTVLINKNCNVKNVIISDVNTEVQMEDSTTEEVTKNTNDNLRVVKFNNCNITNLNIHISKLS